MTDTIRSIPLGKLIAHPDNPNRMSRSNFSKLVGNIKLNGCYEPLVVRPARGKEGFFEIINGHHRCRALAEIGYEKAACVVWEVSDEQVDIFLATLNRLCGRDDLSKKLALLRRLNKKRASGELAKLLPQTAKQIEQLVNLKMPSRAAKAAANGFAVAMVFFVNDSQRSVIEKAVSWAEKASKSPKAVRNARALTFIAGHFLASQQEKSGGSGNGTKKTIE